MDNLDWSDVKTTSDISIASYYLSDDKIGYWYEYIKNTICRITGNSRLVKCGLFG